MFPVCEEGEDLRDPKWPMCDRMLLGGSLVTAKDKLIACAPKRMPSGVSLNTTPTMGACYSILLADIARNSSHISAENSTLTFPYDRKYGEDFQ